MKKLFIYLLMVVALTSCYEDHSEVIPGQDFIPEEIMAKIRENGQPIYDGLEPPDVEGYFLLSPPRLVSSNFDDPYPIGHEFAAEYIRFSDFDEARLTLQVDLEQAGSKGEGYGSFISGSGNNFTIYVRIDNVDQNGLSTLQTRVYSGTMSENGIQNLYTSLFMIDDGGDPENNLIGNGQGRLFRDDDGFSPKL